MTKRIVDKLSVTVAHNTVISISRIEQKEIPLAEYSKTVYDAIALSEFLNNTMSPLFWKAFKKSINNTDVNVNGSKLEEVN
jgi:hypothetical protein